MERDLKHGLTFFEQKHFFSVVLTIHYSDCLSVDEKINNFLNDWNSGKSFKFSNYTINKNNVNLDLGSLQLLHYQYE